MTPWALAAVLGVALLVLAVIGPAMLRGAAPALARVPRLAIAVVGGGIVAWVAALLALGPVLAWLGSGPTLLPGDMAAVCARCLAAANPFSGIATQAAVPAILLLSLPAAITVILVVGVMLQLLRRDRDTRTTAGLLLRESTRVRLYGHEVSLIESSHPVALTLPARHGGIVVSTATVRALTTAELQAVLAHESAHLRQHHHLISALVDSVATMLRWIPLVRAAADALPHYLEIAADDRARRTSSTSALVSALIRLGERRHGASEPAVAVLHAAGPERIRQLVQPAVGTAGALPTVMISAYISALALLSAAVHLPYTSALLTGC